MNCEICGCEKRKTTWLEEAWGRMERITEYNCCNIHCGEGEEE
jgi:hypothetical protein